jgi:hypothetical protein
MAPHSEEENTSKDSAELADTEEKNQHTADAVAVQAEADKTEVQEDNHNSVNEDGPASVGFGEPVSCQLVPDLLELFASERA